MKNRDAVLMRVASVYQDESTCDRNHVGCVIAIEGRVIGTGYNGAPGGMPHCNHACNCGGVLPGDTTHALPHGAGCPATQPCRIAVHAEANAIAFCAKYGLPTNGATLYTTLSPCYSCAQLIINAGLTRVVYGRQYRDISGLTLMMDVDMRLTNWELAI